MLHALQPRRDPPPAPVQAADEAARTAPRRVLRCRTCGRDIADPDDRMELQGAHMHVFVNPHGYDFQVRLFTQAAGAAAVGPATDFYSWFPGYPWRMLVCGGCGGHLGWAWGVPIAFVGLVADRVVEESGPAGD